MIDLSLQKFNFIDSYSIYMMKVLLHEEIKFPKQRMSCHWISIIAWYFHDVEFLIKLKYILYQIHFHPDYAKK